MPATTQRRKASTRSKVVTDREQQQRTSTSISSYTRVSKTLTQPALKKEQTAISPKKTAKLEVVIPASRKRKVATTREDESSADERPSKRVLPSTASPEAEEAQQPVRRRRGRPSKKGLPEPTPRKRARSPSPSDSDDSAIHAGALFKKLRLESSPSQCSSPLTASTSVADSDGDADNELSRSNNRLPDEVLSLIDLHSAFLKTLTLHYAHHGTNVPVDLRVLCPNVARAWGKKQVTDADIRVCLGVLGISSSSCSESPLSLSDYGRGKICVELAARAAHGSSAPLNEKRLNELFRANLQTLWSRSSSSAAAAAAPNNTPATFVSTLPRAAVALCDSVAKAARVQLQGQQRLEDLRHGIAAKKADKEAAAAQAVQARAQAQPQPMAVDDDGAEPPAAAAAAAAKPLSLLDRIRLRSLQQRSSSCLPAAGLTPAQLSRRGALQRVEEVASTLGMLSRASSSASSSSSAGSSARVSWTMAALLSRLRDSFRAGVSRDEAAAAVRLLAADVAPRWVRVVCLAGRGENVVLEPDEQPAPAVVAARVQALLRAMTAPAATTTATTAVALPMAV
ncbi:hypothetical protein GGR56DRAFT_667186 [Xylariaceae sp. FL0804]|nr:hypothetical protein GGR56DRAFT_667186 [Xylariaceae sp. FL0804]